MMRVLLALLFSIVATAHAGEIYKWTDANGKVHFGDRAMQAGTSTAEVVNPQVNVVESRMTQGAPPAAVVQSQGLGRPPALRGERARGVAGSPVSDCEAHWRAYEASTACFQKCAIRRQDGGGLNTASCQCVSVAKPDCRR